MLKRHEVQKRMRKWRSYSHCREVLVFLLHTYQAVKKGKCPEISRVHLQRLKCAFVDQLIEPGDCAWRITQRKGSRNLYGSNDEA